jgi:hypothetical protein
VHTKATGRRQLLLESSAPLDLCLKAVRTTGAAQSGQPASKTIRIARVLSTKISYEVCVRCTVVDCTVVDHITQRLSGTEYSCIGVGHAYIDIQIMSCSTDWCRENTADLPTKKSYIFHSTIYRSFEGKPKCEHHGLLESLTLPFL